MLHIETLARQAWQLREQGYAIDDIANVMGRSTSAIERWICSWTEIADQAPPWHEGLNIYTVHCLEKAGITCREDLVEAWEKGEIQRDQPTGINVSRLVEIRGWLESTDTLVSEALPRAVIIDLPAER